MTRYSLPASDVGLDLALGGPLDAGVVAAAQAAVGGDDDVGTWCGRRRARRAAASPVAAPAAARSRDDLGDLLRVRHGGVHALLRLDDPRAAISSMARVIFFVAWIAADATSKDALLPTCHLASLRAPAVFWRRSAVAELVGVGGVGSTRCGRAAAARWNCSLKATIASPSVVGHAGRCASRRAARRARRGCSSSSSASNRAHVGDRHVVEVALGAGEDRRRPAPRPASGC